MLKLWIILAALGAFRHNGSDWRTPRWMPKARVQYQDGRISRRMAVGNACDYAAMFNGCVITA